MLADANFEKLGVLFNIAAVYSQLAKTCDLTTDAGLKSAFSSFQACTVLINRRRELRRRRPLPVCCT